jgi:integrase
MASKQNGAAVARPLRLPLTDRFASTAAGQKIHYDAGPTRVRGFGLRVASSGTKAWVLNYVTVGGRERRMTIGDFPTWPAAEARKRAAELRRLVDAGRDPLEEKRQQRAAPDMGKLLDDYLDHAQARKRSWRSDRGIIEQFLRPAWGNRKIRDVTRADAKALHRAITAAGKPIRANRTIAIASAIFSFAIDADLLEDNPTRDIRRNPENRRERFLSPDELARLWKVLATWPDQHAAAAVRLLLLTGCRRGELLGARWGEFDLAAAVWNKPACRVKAKRSHRLPLSPEAVAELLRLPRLNSSDYLFPNVLNKNHWQQVRAWPAIREAAGIPDVHLHDQRHTVASLLIAQNFSLPIVGGLLDHSQPSTTARYAHLYDDVLRGATAQLGARLVPAEAA